MARKKCGHGGSSQPGGRKPTPLQIVRSGQVVLDHIYGRSMWGECDRVYKWRDLYATHTELGSEGPFDTLQEAASLILSVTSGSSEISCTELSAEELAAQLRWEWMEDDFELNLNGDSWVFQDDGFRRKQLPVRTGKVKNNQQDGMN